MRRHGWCELNQERSRVDIRKTFLPMWTVGQWHRLPRDDVQSPSLEAVKTRQVLSIS